MLKYTAAVALAVTSTCLHAQGSFDFAQIPGLSASPTVQIDLNPAMLGFVAEATRASDPAAAELLADIRNVRVSVYESVADTQPVLTFVENASAALEREGWQRTVYVDDGAEKVRIYMKLDETQIMGMTVMVAQDGGDAVFVNVDGAIDPLKLGEIARTLGMGGMMRTFGEIGAAAAGAGAGMPAGTDPADGSAGNAGEATDGGDETPDAPAGGAE